MYALFRGKDQVSESYNNLVHAWSHIIMWHPFVISGTVNSLHFAVTLEEGYTIEEVK